MGLLQKQKETELSCVSRSTCRFTGWNEKTQILQWEFSITSSSYKPRRWSIVALHNANLQGLHLTPVPIADNKFINFSGQSLFLPLTNHANFSKNNLHVYWHSHEYLWLYLCYYKAFIEQNILFLDKTTWSPFWYRAQQIFLYTANNCKHGYYWNGNASCWVKIVSSEMKNRLYTSKEE